jgi:hypothetical protein
MVVDVTDPYASDDCASPMAIVEPLSTIFIESPINQCFSCLRCPVSDPMATRRGEWAVMLIGRCGPGL